MRIRTAIIIILLFAGAAAMCVQPARSGAPASFITAAYAQQAKPATPAPQATPAAAPAAGDYVGSDTCISCHDEQHKRIQNTPMGRILLGHPRNDLEKLGCEACHGPGRAHVEAGGGKETIPVRFAKDSKNTVEEQNAACLSCHQKGNRMFWMGSPHESRQLACVDCHTVHYGGMAEHLDNRKLSSQSRYEAPLTETAGIKKTQPELCLQCHQMRRAQLQRSSHMPYREGKVTCTSCHNPHGTPYASQLLQPTVNENCLSCHTERRGPFLWEHPPVMENCANCHEPHGSNNPQLLKARMPRVCDSCHVTSRHPTQAQPLSSVKNFNRGCTNCHSAIHGSNSPSGDKFLR